MPEVLLERDGNMRVTYNGSDYTSNIESTILNEESRIVSEIFVSDFDECNCSDVFLWAVQVSSDLVIVGSGIEDYISFVDYLISRGVRYIFSFDLRELYYFLKGYVTILPTTRPANDGSLYNLCIPGCTYRSIKHISSAKTKTELTGVNISHLKTTRRTKDSNFSNYTKVIEVMNKEWDYVNKFTERLSSLSHVKATRTGKMKTDLFFYIKEHSEYGVTGYRKQIGGWHGEYMQLPSLDYLTFIKSALTGGFIQYNEAYKGCTLEDVAEFDITSAYIYAECAYKFPMRRKFWGTPDDSNFEEYYNCIDNKDYFGLMHIRIRNLEAKYKSVRPLRDHNKLVDYDMSIAGESITGVDGGKKDKLGRYYHADKMSLIINSYEFNILELYYDFDEDFEIYDLAVYKCDYLPKQYTDFVLNKFYKKAKNKGCGTFTEREAKMDVILTWGVFGSGIYDTENKIIDNKIEPKHIDLNIVKDKYNNFSGNFYNRTWNFEWAPFVTMYVRCIILEFLAKYVDIDNDWVYSNTDNFYLRNPEKYYSCIEEYNQKLMDSLLKNPNITHNRIAITNSSNTSTSILGFFTLDGYFTKFKFLGVNKYLGWNKLKNKWKICVGGVSDINTSFLNKIKEPFEWFSRGGKIDAKYCCQFDKYVEFSNIDTDVVDFSGETRHISLKSGCYRTFSGYTL